MMAITAAHPTAMPAMAPLLREAEDPLVAFTSCVLLELGAEVDAESDADCAPEPEELEVAVGFVG